ncbi:NADH-quinone oxidoreductase subunit NuoK [candidate division CSSED10-310 bacterium]|uniref:NADH-quinone oxidoreductase subunit K n=1 Tax=candidate division CSSED10-310 bacterium TaxID=2855610 RepID=A0ABV6Z3J4_UNCC1
MITLHSYLIISAILFILGLFAVLCRRNAVAVLMGIELMINSCAINLVAFNHFVKHVPHSNPLSGQVFTLFIIILAAAEAAVALAIILSIYQHFRKIDVMDLEHLKH